MSLQLEYLPTEEMDHVRTDTLDLSAVPLFHRIFCQPVKILMVAGNKQEGEGQLLQPVQLAAFPFAAVPDPAEIAADDDKIILGHILLFREVFLLKSFKIPMGISGDVDHGRSLQWLLLAIIP